jgi:hypothetical protein
VKYYFLAMMRLTVGLWMGSRMHHGWTIAQKKALKARPKSQLWGLSPHRPHQCATALPDCLIYGFVVSMRRCSGWGAEIPRRMFLSAPETSPMRLKDAVSLQPYTAIATIRFKAGTCTLDLCAAAWCASYAVGPVNHQLGME